MNAVLRLAVIDLLRQWKLGLVMALVIALSLFIYLTTSGYSRALERSFALADDQTLVVQEAESFGEIYGSRLSIEVADYLRSLGVEDPIPEIHEVTGVSYQDLRLVRGVDLARYRAVDAFTLLEGAALGPESPARVALVGKRLAESDGLRVGGALRLRGRDFQVIGIFETGTYADNEAWVALADAQALLGMGTDVSVYLVSAQGPLRAGQALPGGLAAARRGESGQALSDQYQDRLTLNRVLSAVLAGAAALTLTNVLWRLAWMRRRTLAVLRSLGFGRGALALYLVFQGVLVTLAGGLLSAGCVAAFQSAMGMAVFGFDIHPVFDLASLGLSAAWVMGVALAGSALPAWWLARRPLAEMLPEEL